MFPDQQNAQTYAQMPVPSKRSNSYFVAFVIATVIAVAIGGFAVWQYLDTASLKTDFDAEVANAVDAKEEEIRQQLQVEFDEEAKLPNKTAKLVESLGGVSFSYPKTWSLYAVEKTSTTKILDAYGHPNIVPNISGETAFALRAEVLSTSYDSVLKNYNKQVTNAKASSRPYKSNGVLGVKIEGELDSKTTGVMVILPFRDKTIKLWTASNSYKADFLKIAESLKFSP